MPETNFDQFFLTPVSLDAYRLAMTTAVESVANHYGALTRCHSGASASTLAAAIGQLKVCPDQGEDLATLCERIGREILAHSLVVSNPTCIAHLHCPPLLPALAAEAMISAINQSMDSWDQAPAATYIEQHVVNWLCQLFGLNTGDGIFTSGGTQSNFMGLLLARDTYARERLGWDIQRQGLPREAERFRILCSASAHFSVKQSAALLGLGHKAVVPVAVDPSQRLRLDVLETTIETLRDQGQHPIAIVATAGTTDFGSIDPLPEIADSAQRHGLWLHVDAAYGGALALSQRHAPRLTGIERADSLTIDFHKLFYQPISCGAFLVRKREAFGLIRLHADYLNPEANEVAGILDLVGKSIQTTRRFDGLKLLMTLNTLGREGMAQMIEATLERAQRVAQEIRLRPEFELASDPTLNAVVFRHHGQDLSPEQSDALNTRIRDQMMSEGFAWLAQTRHDGRVFLKMTLLNPRTSDAHIVDILNYIKHVATLSRH